MLRPEENVREKGLSAGMRYLGFRGAGRVRCGPRKASGKE